MTLVKMDRPSMSCFSMFFSDWFWGRHHSNACSTRSLRYKPSSLERRKNLEGFEACMYHSGRCTIHVDHCVTISQWYKHVSESSLMEAFGIPKFSCGWGWFWFYRWFLLRFDGPTLILKPGWFKLKHDFLQKSVMTKTCGRTPKNGVYM